MFAAAAFATTSAAAPRGGAALRVATIRMILCLFCGVAGAFAASRGVHLARLTVAAAVVCGLAGAVYAGVLGHRASFFVALVPLAVVCLSAVFDGAWSPLAAAAIAAVPFGVCAAWFPRPAATCDALLCAVTGATLGLFPAILVLFAAALTALAVGRLTKAEVATFQFAPYLAGFTLFGVLTTLIVAT